MAIAVGQAAPDFSLKDQNQKDVKLSDYRGKNVVIVFYPLDWSPICTNEHACFVNDLATVVALGFKFSPFTFRTLTFVGGSCAAFAIMPWLVPRFFKRYGGRPSELETKVLLLVMFGLGALALWAGSEPVLPAYVLA